MPTIRSAATSILCFTMLLGTTARSAEGPGKQKQNAKSSTEAKAPTDAKASPGAKPSGQPSAAPRPSTDGTVIKLWPGTPPGETKDLGPEQQTKKDDVVTSITNVSEPTIKVYPAPADKSNGVAILIAPGGGYRNLAWDHEGEQIAAWANSIGITGVILKYRVPRREGTASTDPPPGALQDAQRALGIIRSKASEWKIQPNKVGMLGFSAGGHLCAWTSTNFASRTYNPVDEADKLSCRPDFSVLIYPGGTIETGTINLRPQIKVDKETPPSFLAMAHDDHVNTENCIALYMAMKKAGVSAEMHIYAKGGHGFGMRPNATPASTWTDRCREWMKVIGMME